MNTDVPAMSIWEGITDRPNGCNTKCPSPFHGGDKTDEIYMMNDYEWIHDKQQHTNWTDTLI